MENNSNDFFQTLLSDLENTLQSLRPYFLNIGSFGDIDSCHGKDISWFEMFARATYGIVPYTHIKGKNKYSDTFNSVILKIIEDNRYTTFKNHDQKAVELIPIALMLYLHRDITWDTYTQEQREKIVAFLENINKIELIQNNWIFFRLITCSILSELTGKDYKTIIEKDWNFIDKCYVGDGWYRDGLYGPKDYYIAWGYHFYSLLYRFLFRDEKRNETIARRAIEFAKQYFYMFDEQGRMIPYGRSLIYRFASLSFWSMFLLNDLQPDLEGRIMSLIQKSMDCWRSQSIRNNDGIINLGYSYRNETLCENYNSSGSVYWVLKFYLILLLGKPKQIGQYNENNGTHVIANGDIVITNNENWNTMYVNSYEGGHTTQNSAKYMRFAYNSESGFNLSKDPTNFHQLSDDSSLIFDIGGVKHMREKNLLYQNTGSIQDITWECKNLMQIRSIIIPLESGYIRVHLINSKLKCKCYETGFAISNESARKNCIGTTAELGNNNLTTSISLIKGDGKCTIIDNECNSNIYHKHTSMPAIEYSIKKGTTVISDYTSIAKPNNNRTIDLTQHIQFKRNKFIVFLNGQEYTFTTHNAKILQAKVLVKKIKNKISRKIGKIPVLGAMIR